ncbi:MAG: sigma-70 family RNA polymerase sigma factor [Sporichthyaceae bacterium]
MDDLDLRWCLDRSAAGDSAAWQLIATRFTPLLWAVARSHRLGQSDAADAVQSTWLRLVENLGRIRDPDRLGAWLATTCRRECLAVIRRAARERPVDQQQVIDLTDSSAPAVDATLLLRQRDATLWSVFESLNEPCRRLLRVLMADPPPSYEEVGAALAMPVGSIGPTRGRCLRRLHDLVLAAGISRGDLASVEKRPTEGTPSFRGARPEDGRHGRT